MKLFKKLAGLCLALTFCAGLCAVASCGGSSKDDDSTPVTSEEVGGSENGTSEAPGVYSNYTVIVLNADGTPATDVRVQFCYVQEDGTLGGCLSPVAVDSNGICEYNPMGFPGVGVYEIHVLPVGSSTPLAVQADVRTEAAFGTYTVTLAE